MRLLLAKGADASLKAPAVESIVDRTFRTMVKDGYPGAAVLVAQDGKVRFRRAYGSACLENRVAATPETRYRIGSVTKQFTAAAVLELVEAGAVSTFSGKTLTLDIAGADLFPGVEAWTVAGQNPITLRSLLNNKPAVAVVISRIWALVWDNSSRKVGMDRLLLVLAQ